MKAKILIVLVALVTANFTYSQTTKRSPYIGYKYRGVVPSSTLPNGIKHFGGGLIGDINADSVYGLSEVQKGKTKMVWLEVSTGKDSRGVTGWKVLDVLSFPVLTKSDYFFYYGDPAIGCTRAGADIANLIGVGRIIRNRSIFRPSKLWVADLETKKFKSISLSGIKCEYSEP